MEKIFVAIASQLGVDKANLRFTFDGKRVQAGWLFFRHDYLNDCQTIFLPDIDVQSLFIAENTPKMLEMEDEDQIDCMIEQVGGMNFH
jgi:hypothetical protein